MKISFFFSLLFSIVFSISGYSQCISGNTTIYVGQTVTLSSVTAAQCTSCYDWDINNAATSSDNSVVGNIQIIGSDMNQTVNIKGLTAGNFTVQLTYFDETGCHQCNVIGKVVQPVSMLGLPPCFGFDPVRRTDVTNEGVLNYGYIGNPYSAPIPSVGLTFKWYFLFKNGVLLTFDVQNPTFRELCPTNEVKSFALIVSNGVQSRAYRAVYPNYGIPDVPGRNTTTCFIHEDCSPETIIAGQNQVINSADIKPSESLKMSVFPNPVSNNLTVVFDKQVSDTEGSSSQLELYNLQGQLLKQQPLEAGFDETKVSMQQLPAGVYMISLRQNGQIISSAKVTKN